MSGYEPGDTMVEALRRANPVPNDLLADRRSSPASNALLAEILSQRPRRVRKRGIAIAIAIVLILAVLAAFAFVRRDHAALPLETSCYARASLDSPRVLVPSGSDPAQACAKFWTDGTFGRGAVPDFDVCVLPEGVTAAFPGESGSVCSRLGLPEASVDEKVDSSLGGIGPLVAQHCIGGDAARSKIEHELARRRVRGWKIARAARPFDADHPCASVAIDVAARTITIVPEANPFVAPTSSAP